MVGLLALQYSLTHLPRLYRDRKKKKFVTVGQTDAKTKKIKTESGQWIQASYKTNVYVEDIFRVAPFSTMPIPSSYKKWLNKSKVLDKELPDSRRRRADDHIQDDEISSAQHKPRKTRVAFARHHPSPVLPLPQDNSNNA